MQSIDFLEFGHGARFRVRWTDADGIVQEIRLPNPADKHYQWVLTALGLEHVPGTPEGIPEWQRALVFRRWQAAWALPDFANARRLAYLVDNYRAALNNDLSTRANLDLGECWRGRQWTLLLDIIDRLPSHSWFSAAVANDPDHAKMMAEAIASRKSSAVEDNDTSGPALTTWTPEVAALTNVLDAVRHVGYAVVAVQAGNKAGEAPKPSPRPVTLLEKALRRAEFDRKKAAHEKLVARMLPHKAKN